MIKVKFEGIKSVGEQNAIEIKALAKTIAARIEKTNPEKDGISEMRVQLKEVPAHRHIATGRTELQMKLFFDRGPMFLLNKPAAVMLEENGFAPRKKNISPTVT
jgi:hypothetical protein